MDKYSQRMDNIVSFDLGLQSLISAKLKNIDDFNTKWTEIEVSIKDGFLKELQELSTVQSIGSSTRIEGSKLSDQEIKNLIANLDINKLKSRDEEEVSGYYETLDLIYENYENIFLSESYLKQLHNTLLKYSSKDSRHRGEYKSLSNKVVASYPDGSSRVVFDTTEPYLTASEMSSLLQWTNEKLTYTGIHSLIVLAAFVYEFLSIHPFQDGNGRLSRLLTNLLLMKSGYKFIRYISFEHVIETRKKEYYQNLMECQKNRNNEKENISLWVIYFLDCIENLISNLQTRLSAKSQRTNSNINPRQQEILDLIKSKQSLTVAIIIKNLAHIPIATIKYDLNALVKAGLISRHGQGKGTWYEFLD